MKNIKEYEKNVNDSLSICQKKIEKLKEIEKYYYEQVRDIFQLIEKI